MTGTCGTKTALYLRTSSERQHTINQRPDLDRLVEARGYAVVAVYEEQVSAAKMRPQFDLMMKHAHEGRFAVLIVWSIDRLGRNMMSNMQAVLDLDRRGVRVVSVKEPWLEREMGAARQLLLGIMSWVAEQERARIGERVRAGLNRVRDRGVKLGRPRTHVPVAAAVAMRAQGKSLREVAAILGVSTSVLHRSLAASHKSDLEPGVQPPGSATSMNASR